jgi:uncharacterized protein YhbP (UPF0306 family)
LEGQVSLLSNVSRETAISRYLQKYPFLANADKKMQAAIERVNWYVLQPERLYFIDNSLGLGHRDEISL